MQYNRAKGYYVQLSFNVDECKLNLFIKEEGIPDIIHLYLIRSMLLVDPILVQESLLKGRSSVLNGHYQS